MLNTRADPPTVEEHHGPERATPESLRVQLWGHPDQLLDQQLRRSAAVLVLRPEGRAQLLGRRDPHTEQRPGHGGDGDAGGRSRPSYDYADRAPAGHHAFARRRREL